jgi:uncharacterized protein YcgI (DUF1989 family)
MLWIDARRDFGSRAASGDIPQLQATAIRIKPDERLRIVNHLGQQVLDTWIFAADAPFEFMSMEHCRDQLYKLFFEVGDELISNRRRPLARIAADTSPGGHDTLCAACDFLSYERQGHGTDHPNCRNNFLTLLEARDDPAAIVPCPWNLFMDIPVASGGQLSDRPSGARPGDYIELTCLLEAVVICSPCPQDRIPISGEGRPPRGLRWERIPSSQ